MTQFIAERYGIIYDNLAHSEMVSAVYQSFTENATVGILFSGEVAYGIYSGGSCAFASMISSVVKPVFMGLVGYKKHDQPSTWLNISCNVVVLSIHAYLVMPRILVVNLIGIAVLAAISSDNRCVSQAHAFYKIETIIALVVFEKIKLLVQSVRGYLNGKSSPVPA